MSDDRVAVPKTMLMGLGALVAVSLLAVAFLLGRQAGSRDETPPARNHKVASTPAQRVEAPASPRDEPPATTPDRSHVTTPDRAPATTPDRAPATTPDRAPATTPEKTPDRAPATAPEKTPVRAPATTQSEASPTPKAHAVDPAMKKKVAAYFEAMQRALKVAKDWDTADSVTQAAISQSTRRDPRQFQAILQANQKAMEEVNAIHPPEPCRAHHQLAQKVLRNAVQLVGNVAAATMAGNMDDLGEDLAPAARALRQDVERMRGMRLDICHKYGIN